MKLKLFYYFCSNLTVTKLNVLNIIFNHINRSHYCNIQSWTVVTVMNLNNTGICFCIHSFCIVHLWQPVLNLMYPSFIQMYTPLMLPCISLIYCLLCILLLNFIRLPALVFFYFHVQWHILNFPFPTVFRELNLHIIFSEFTFVIVFLIH